MSATITQHFAGGVEVDQELVKAWERSTPGRPKTRFSPAGRAKVEKVRRLKTVAVRTSPETKYPQAWRNTVGKEYVERYNRHFGDWEIYRGTEPTGEPES